MNAITSLSESKATGKVWNYADNRFFGKLVDKEMTKAEEAVNFVKSRLPFVTGVYHTAAVEIAAACLSVKL